MTSDHQENYADEIVPGVWLGGIKALNHLEELKIDAVVTAMHQDKPGIEQRLVDRIGKRDWLRFFWYDDPTQKISRKELEEAATFIEKHVRGGRRRVLIHCWAGHSRSVSIVLFYLMNKTRDFKTVEAALQFIQEKRPTINPNPGFLVQLKKHNKEKE